jgi:Ca2+/H+ antiporter, TMEM165/GDT1 family
MSNWTHVGPTVIAAFLASLVEFVEALTIVLAVGTVRGWRPALIGTGAGAVALVLLVGILGPALTSADCCLELPREISSSITSNH